MNLDESFPGDKDLLKSEIKYVIELLTDRNLIRKVMEETMIRDHKCYELFCNKCEKKENGFKTPYSDKLKDIYKEHGEVVFLGLPKLNMVVITFSFNIREYEYKIQLNRNKKGMNVVVFHDKIFSDLTIALESAIEKCENN